MRFIVESLLDTSFWAGCCSVCWFIREDRENLVLKFPPACPSQNNNSNNINKQDLKHTWGTCVAQLVKCPAFDLGSGHDLMVYKIEPRVGLCTDSMEPAWDSLSLPLSLSFPLSFSLSLCLSLSISIKTLKRLKMHMQKPVG